MVTHVARSSARNSARQLILRNVPLWQGGGGGKGGGGEGEEEPVSHDEKPVKSRFNPSGYDKDLVESLERDIVQTNPNVHW